MLVTIPVDAPTVAIPEAPLVHTPPVVVLESVDVAPTQADTVPVIVAGSGFTVTVETAKHPVGNM